MSKPFWSGKKLRKTMRRLGEYCKSFGPAVILTLLGILVILASFGVIHPASFKDPLVTTTVNASTESFHFQVPHGRESAWSLPPGDFSILGTSDIDQCETNDFEAVCSFPANTRLVVDGAANILLQVSPGGGWRLSVAETETQPADIRLYDAQGSILLQSEQLLEFYATKPAYAIRVPFVADSAVLGADLHQPATIDGSAYDFWQPIMLAGDVLMIANNRPARETYQVLEERLDPGDVLHIGDGEAVELENGPSTVWGMVTVVSDDTTDESGNAVFDVVLHTSLNEVLVTRFGAPEGHIIRASYWTIRQKWPNGQSAWILFVSVVLVLTFVLQLRESIDTLRSERAARKSAKKNKNKNKKRPKNEK